jgi:mono/diheme cytochrome c family protein
VKGEKYNGVMVPWGVSLDDNQVAAVVNYVRSSFGNSAPPVTLADVTRMREATKTRTVQYTEAELAALR